MDSVFFMGKELENLENKLKNLIGTVLKQVQGQMHFTSFKSFRF